MSSFNTWFEWICGVHSTPQESVNNLGKHKNCYGLFLIMDIVSGLPEQMNFLCICYEFKSAGIRPNSRYHVLRSTEKISKKDIWVIAFSGHGKEFSVGWLAELCPFTTNISISGILKYASGYLCVWGVYQKEHSDEVYFSMVNRQY